MPKRRTAQHFANLKSSFMPNKETLNLVSLPKLTSNLSVAPQRRALEGDVKSATKFGFKHKTSFEIVFIGLVIVFIIFINYFERRNRHHLLR